MDVVGSICGWGRMSICVCGREHVVHPHMWMWSGAYVVDHMGICGCGWGRMSIYVCGREHVVHVHMWMWSGAYVVDHMGICG